VREIGKIYSANIGKMIGGDKHLKRKQLSMAVHYAAIMKRERRVKRKGKNKNKEVEI
jgi:hypothetical protein